MEQERQTPEVSLNRQAAENIAENAWLKLAGRALMTLVGVTFIPAATAIFIWAARASESLSAVSYRVSTVERSIDRINKDNDQANDERIKFQDQTLRQLAEILRSVSATNERLVRLEAQFEYMRREQQSINP